MASQCKRQQCTIDRRGFRQELDSWRHKLIHCVGFESILEGLFTPELVEDLRLFKDCEPTAVSDWSFVENCLFCCFRRDKVKEHLIGLSSDGLEDTKSVLVKDKSAISRLEKQAEEFLHAVLSRKDVPNFSDPNIPVVAREILQRMIRQFAAEYTSKTSGSAQDPQPCSDRSLPTTPSPSGAKPPSSSPPGTPAGPTTHSQAGTPKHNQAGTPAAHSLNPVLSKLLMADQDAPLDLTIKKPPPLPSDQDGVLDLSIKKSRSLSARSPCLSPAPATLKGESSDLAVTRAKDLQSTSTLEQFMAKLCPHHQRQIVDAIGFLQTEVKALTSSNTQQDPNSSTGNHGTARSKAKSSVVTPEKSDPRLKFPSESTFKSEVQDMSCSTPSSCAVKKVPESPVSIKTSVTAGPGLDLRSPGSASNPSLHSPTAHPVDAENKHHGDHAPLKIKIMTSNVAAGKKLSCVLNTSLSSLSDPSEDREAISNSPSKTETHSARLSSSVKRHNQPAHTNQARQRGTPGHAKDPQAKLFSVHVTIPSDSPRTARKTIRGSSDHRIGDSSCRVMADPDLGHCDIVFIDKPITECFKEQRHKMVPRRNARKSTRGHMYSDEIWELKTVRTLAGRGNCPNPMPELITLVTPKQILSKPEGVPPPVDMPVVVACGDTVNQPMATEESNVSILPGTGDMVEIAASEVDVVVETSQTDQCHNKAQSVCPSPIRSPTENKETDSDTHVEQETVEDSGTTTEDSGTTVEDSGTTVEDSGTTVADSGTTTTGSEESVGQAPLEAEQDHEPQPEPQEDIPESTEPLMAEPIVEPLENVATVVAETQLSSETLDSEPIPEQNSSPSPVKEVEEEENHMEETPEEQHQVEEHQKEEHKVEEPQEKGNQIEENQIEENQIEENQIEENQNEENQIEDNQKEEIQDEHPQEPLPEMPIDCENLEVTEKSDTTGPAEEVVVKEPEAKTSEVADSVMPEDVNDTDYDVTTKSLDALLKELPPWRRKRGTVILLPKRLRQTETTVVGFVNGRPISASDRSLRRRSSNSATSPGKAPFKSRKKASVDSTVENKNVEKNLDQTQIKSVETTPVIVKVEEASSSATPSSLELKSPLKTKQIRKQKSVQKDRDGLPVPADQSTGPKRQLRSAGQMPAVTPPSSNAVSSISSPKPTTTHALPATEHQISPTDTSLLPATSSPVGSDPSAQTQQNIVPETSMELNIDQNQSLEKTSEEVEKNEIESALLTKQELRSTKAVADESKNETKQPSDEVSSLLESQSPVKTEVQTQVLPLRSRRVLQKELEASDVSLLQKPNSASSEDGAAGGYESSSGSLISDKRKRMPLRSESSKSEMSASKSPPSKLALRSQRLAGPSTSAGTVAGRPIDASSPVRIKQERVTKAQVRSPPASHASVLPHNSGLPMITPRPEPPKQMPNKFFQNLTAEENQHRITNLNIKFDKMQKGWVQMDKEGQPATKYKNKSDRQAAIWKSKRRARKSKSLEHQKYSPVQMLFMKGFNLTSICRWFLESTETKSLVIVKKVNTRLPSETQLCFHSSSSAGTSQGVFPSLQAERLKKHLKKFAIASPVKSNPKSQKLLAKALEQMGNTGKGKEKRELPSTTTQTLIQSDLSAEACVQKGESQKSSGKSKNPASARILRKYSNIREKMQVQQTNVRLKEASQSLKTNSMKRVAPTKSAAKSNLKPSLKAKKSHLPKSLVKKQIKQSAAKMEGRKTHKKAKHPVLGRTAKAQSNGKASKDTTKKILPKRSSQRQQQHNPAADTSKSKTNNKKQMEAEKVEVERPSVNRMNASKTQAKEAPQGTVAAEIKGAENAVETPQPGTDVKVSTSPDQVLTRSQRKIDAAVPSNGGPKGKRKYTKSIKKELASPKSGKEVKKAEEPKLTRSGSLKTPVKRNQAAVSSPRIATKSATKRAMELLQTPAKRTRTSLTK